MTTTLVGINFTDRSHRILETALRTAQSCRSVSGVDTSHLLHAVLTSDEASIPIVALQNLHVDLVALRALVLSAAAPKVDPPASFLPVHTPASLDALKEAAEYAKMFGHPYVGAEHLFLGLLSDTDSIACKLISSLPVAMKAIRQEVLDLLGIDHSLIAERAARSTEIVIGHRCTLKAEKHRKLCVEICTEEPDGTLWATNGNERSRVNFCPVCGFKAKIAATDLIPYPANAPAAGSMWKHFKGDPIPVRCMARHSEDKEPLVIYEHLGEVWARPLSMWHDEVTGGKKRFSPAEA